MIHTLNRTQVVPAPPAKVWDFIADPQNLNRITPENMAFEILTRLPEVMYPGLLIEYRVKIPNFGRWRWLTEIKHIRPGISFVDEQRVGPYALWYHYHQIRALEGGTEILDRVTYRLPAWVLGDLLNALMVRRQLEEVFDYRRIKFLELLSD